MEHHRHCQEGVAVLGHSPSAGARDFGDQAPHVQTFEQAGDSSGVTVGLGGVTGVGQQMGAKVSIDESSDEVFPAQHGGQEADVVGAGRIEAPMATTLAAYRSDQGMDLLIKRSRIIHDGQSVEVTAIGDPTDLGVAVQVGHSLGPGEPGGDAPAFSNAPSSGAHSEHDV